jgi:hypothetical protein
MRDRARRLRNDLRSRTCLSTNSNTHGRYSAAGTPLKSKMNCDGSSPRRSRTTGETSLMRRFVASFGSGGGDQQMAWNQDVLWSQRRRRNVEVSGQYGLESSRFLRREAGERKPRLRGLRRPRTTNCPPAMSTGTFVDPGHRLGSLPVGAISHRLSFIKSGNSSSRQWGIKT